MTANQVAYWQLQESRRHNTVDEGRQAELAKAQIERMQKQNALDTASTIVGAITSPLSAVGNVAKGVSGVASAVLQKSKSPRLNSPWR